MAGGPQQVSLVEATLSGVYICSHLPPSLALSASCPHCLSFRSPGLWEGCWYRVQRHLNFYFSSGSQGQLAVGCRSAVDMGDGPEHAGFLDVVCTSCQTS